MFVGVVVLRFMFILKFSWMTYMTRIVIFKQPTNRPTNQPIELLPIEFLTKWNTRIRPILHTRLHILSFHFDSHAYKNFNRWQGHSDAHCFVALLHLIKSKMGNWNVQTAGCCIIELLIECDIARYRHS